MAGAGDRHGFCPRQDPGELGVDEAMQWNRPFAADKQDRHPQARHAAAVDRREWIARGRRRLEEAGVLQRHRARRRRECAETRRPGESVDEDSHAGHGIVARECLAGGHPDLGHERVIQGAARRILACPVVDGRLREHQATHTRGLLHCVQQGGQRAGGGADQMDAAELQRLDDGSQVLRVCVAGAIGRGERVVVGVVVTPAVRDHAIAFRQRLGLGGHRAVVALPAVQQDQRLAGAGLDVVELGAVGDDALERRRRRGDCHAAQQQDRPQPTPPVCPLRHAGMVAPNPSGRSTLSPRFDRGQCNAHQGAHPSWTQAFAQVIP